MLLDTFAAAALVVLDALPETAWIEIKVGDDGVHVPPVWLQVRSLAKPEDAALRAKGIAEVDAALHALPAGVARFRVTVGDHAAGLTRGGGGLCWDEANLRWVSMTAWGGDHAPDASARDVASRMLRSLVLQPLDTV
jgi:hypothetical protein